MSPDLLTPSFLFRFSLPLLRNDRQWPACTPLADDYKLLTFTALDDGREYVDVRGAWSDEGLTFSVRVAGKKHRPWCRENQPDDSDGFHLWIDTRDTKNIHRASRFCHHFVFLPTGGGHRLDRPVAEQVLINRARENANPVRPGVLKVESEKRVDGYVLDCHIPAAALTAYDPDDHAKLGFMYAVVDRELGEQTLAYNREFPYQEDPSVWCTLELVKR
jgi:hypothetical protein